MADRTVRVRLELLASMFKRSAAECGKAVRDVDQALDKVDGRNIDLDTKPAIRGLEMLRASAEKSQAKILAMQTAFKQTGDVGFLRDLRKEEANLKRLNGWIRNLGDDSVKSSKKVGVLDRSMQGAGEQLRRAFPTSSAFANPMILGAGASAAAILLIPAAAAVGGLALAGLGVGFIGLGAVAVRKSEQVTRALTSLGDDAQATFEDAGRSMEVPITRALNIIHGTVNDLGPDLREMFDDVSPHVEGVANAVSSLAKNAMPGLKRAASESGGVLDDFSAKLPETGTAVSDFFDSVSDGADGASRGLTTLMGLLNFSIGQIGGTIEYGSKALDFFTEGSGRFVTTWTGPWVKSLGDVTPALRESGMSAEAAGRSYSVAAADAQAMGDSVQVATEKIAGASLGLFSSQTRAAEALRGLKESLQENGRTFSLATEAGLKNRAMLERYGLAARAARDDAVALATAQGKDGPAAAAAGIAAQNAYANSLRVTLRNAKFSEQAINSLFVAIGLIPPVVPINVKEKGAADAKAKITDAAKPRKTTVTALANQSSVNAVEGRLTRTSRPRSAWFNAADRGSANVDARLNRVARPRTAPIVATASANAAEARLNAAARARTATIYVRTVGSANALEHGSVGGVVGSLPVKKFAYGGFSGLVSGPGTTTSDSILAALSRKEYVVKASSVERIGLPAMEFMNRTGTVPAVAGASRPSWDGAQMQPAQTPNFNVRVFVGDREIHDIVRVEVGAYDREAGRKLAHGRR